MTAREFFASFRERLRRAIIASEGGTHAEVYSHDDFDHTTWEVEYGHACDLLHYLSVRARRPAVEDRKAAQRALERFVEAACELDSAWHDSLNSGYPPCLPSFDDFVNQLLTWRDEVRS